MSMHQMAAENRQMVVAHCLVCAARNAKQHYGSWCCNGCKGFFWRTVSSKRRYICLNSGRGGGSALDKCEIQDGRRNSCRACRLMRCLDVGMDPNLIRDSWGKSTALKKQASLFGEDKDQPKQPKQQSAISIPSPLLMNNKTQQLGLHQANSENNSPQQQWREMSPSNCSLHSQCSHNSPTPPHLLHQQDIGKGGTENVQLLTDYLEWIQTIAELELFSEQDKNLLILNRARPSGWFILANNFFNKTHQELTTVGRGKMEVLQSEIVEPLRELLVNKLEFELLRLISFFSTVPQLSEDGKRLVQQLQGKYVCSLSEFALKQCLPLPTFPSPAASLSSGVLRVNRIIHFLSTVEKIAHQYD